MTEKKSGSDETRCGSSGERWKNSCCDLSGQRGICGPFIAVLAKDSKTPSDEVNVMALELIRDDEMRGTFTWNSLTSGVIKSEGIRWTRNPSVMHSAAYKKVGSASP